MSLACSQKSVERYLANRLNVVDKLAFLLHVEECRACWDAVFHATRAQHPHFYRVVRCRKQADLEAPMEEVA